jgi:hypothetical protein
VAVIVELVNSVSSAVVGGREFAAIAVAFAKIPATTDPVAVFSPFADSKIAESFKTLVAAAISAPAEIDVIVAFSSEGLSPVISNGSEATIVPDASIIMIVKLSRDAMDRLGIQLNVPVFATETVALLDLAIGILRGIPTSNTSDGI